MGGGGSSHETHYTYVDNTAIERERARQRELERLEQERRQREHEERLRIEEERRKEEETKRAEYERQRKLEKAQDEERRRKEEEKRMRLEKELCLRRHELFNYKFGNKTGLDSFGGLELDDVTQLRIGVFGATGSGKSCFINTCERTVRQTEKGSAPDSSTGQEGTITLQDYLPELFFRLVDTRGFFKYNANEIVEFQNILHGKIQPGDNVIRSPEDRGSAASVNLHPCSTFANRLHGIIIVVMANDPRLRKGTLEKYLSPFWEFLCKTGLAPITAVTHRDKLNSQEECDNALHQASEATGSSSDHTFFVHNYTRDNSKRNPETERMIFDILHCALLTAEKTVKVMKQRKMEEDAKALNSVEASVEVFLRHLQNDHKGNHWSTSSLKEVLNKLTKDDVTSVRLLAMCWGDVQAHFPLGMKKTVEKELKSRNMID